MRRKIIPALVAVTLSVVLLSGCGRSSDLPGFVDTEPAVTDETATEESTESTTEETAESSTEDMTDDLGDLTNPIKEYTSTEEAAADNGYSFETPESVGDGTWTRVSIETIHDIYAVDYSDGEMSVTEARKCKEGTDVTSGMYDYCDPVEIQLAGITVTEYVDGNTPLSVVWTRNGYEYAVIDLTTDGLDMNLAEEMVEFMVKNNQ